jgi:branched-chain amino acid transport system permease protein
LPFFPFMNDYWIDVAFFVGIYSLLGLSLNIVLGEVGLFDLGHTAFYAIGAYTTAIRKKEKKRMKTFKSVM